METVNRERVSAFLAPMSPVLLSRWLVWQSGTSVTQRQMRSALPAQWSFSINPDFSGPIALREGLLCVQAWEDEVLHRRDGIPVVPPWNADPWGPEVF